MTVIKYNIVKQLKNVNVGVINACLYCQKVISTFAMEDCWLIAVFEMELEMRVASTRLHIRDGSRTIANEIVIVVEIEGTIKRATYGAALFWNKRGIGWYSI